MEGTQTIQPTPSRPTADRRPDAGDGRGAGLALVDLHLDFSRLRSLAVQEAHAGRWLDALLLAAGAAQVLDDHLHHSKTWPKRLHEQLAHADRTAARQAGRAARAGLDLVGAVRRRRPADRRLIASRAQLLGLTVELATGALATGPVAPDLAARLQAVFADGERWPAELERTVVTLPSCFRSFDQHPQDLVALARSVAAELPDRGSPLLVVGVRSSGSYLGPLLAAALRAEGFTSVRLSAIRPDDHLDHGQRAAARSVGGGTALVVDDPPVSGDSLAESADALVRAGVDPDHVLIALAVDGPADRVPPALADRRRVLLPGADWYLPGRFTEDAVSETLQRLLGTGTQVVDVREVPWPGPQAPVAPSTIGRDHRRTAFRVQLEEGEPGPAPEVRTLLVESTGQGWFGRHAAAVADRLPGRTPASIGFDDGLHLQWLPSVTTVLDSVPSADLVVDHLVARHDALALDVDPSADFEGRQSVVEVATEILAGALGPAGPPARLRVVAAAVRRVLRTPSPVVVDGRVTLDRFLAGPDGALVKLDAADGAFSHRDLATYDPAFDVAQLAETPIGAAVRAGWESRTGAPIAPERWLLHRLVHRWDRWRHRQLSVEDARRTTARALQRYLAEVLIRPAAAPATGPWVALDVDGVLEGPVLDASAPGRTGASALAALLAHEHRVVLATGRCVADVADRVEAWGLTAGVAEYGVALVVGDTVVDLRTDDEQALVADVRRLAEALPGVDVDPDHVHSVRAFRLDGSGCRTGLTPEQLDALLAGLPDAGAVRVVPGEAQTDLVPAGCTKEGGVRALLERLDAERASAARPLALAVGDGPGDLGLLDLAERPFLPHHARHLARAGDGVTRGAYQAGLADAVADLLGHAPGACPRCQVDLSPDARFVLALLSLREAGPRGLPSRLARVVTTAGGAGRAARKPEERSSTSS